MTAVVFWLFTRNFVLGKKRAARGWPKLAVSGTFCPSPDILHVVDWG